MLREIPFKSSKEAALSVTSFVEKHLLLNEINGHYLPTPRMKYEAKLNTAKILLKPSTQQLLTVFNQLLREKQIVFDPKYYYLITSYTFNLNRDVDVYTADKLLYRLHSFSQDIPSTLTKILNTSKLTLSSDSSVPIYLDIYYIALDYLYAKHLTVRKGVEVDTLFSYEPTLFLFPKKVLISQLVSHYNDNVLKIKGYRSYTLLDIVVGLKGKVVEQMWRFGQIQRLLAVSVINRYLTYFLAKKDGIINSSLWDRMYKHQLDLLRISEFIKDKTEEIKKHLTDKELYEFYKERYASKKMFKKIKWTNLKPFLAKRLAAVKVRKWIDSLYIKYKVKIFSVTY